MSDSVWPHRRPPTRLPRPWGSPGKNTGVGCHFLLQCMKVKSEREVTQSCPTLSDPMDCSPPGSSAHGIFQARVLEWGAIAFSEFNYKQCLILMGVIRGGNFRFPSLKILFIYIGGMFIYIYIYIYIFILKIFRLLRLFDKFSSFERSAFFCFCFLDFVLLRCNLLCF